MNYNFELLIQILVSVLTILVAYYSGIKKEERKYRNSIAYSKSKIYIKTYIEMYNKISELSEKGFKLSIVIKSSNNKHSGEDSDLNLNNLCLIADDLIWYGSRYPIVSNEKLEHLIKCVLDLTEELKNNYKSLDDEKTYQICNELISYYWKIRKECGQGLDTLFREIEEVSIESRNN